ncbi:ArsR/SmtB family transcription factor [Trichlorobacter ammonificans]|nr:metalloregulator ArsR/SmtB family transcription factor [Trichlorobacter ammonificans]
MTVHAETISYCARRLKALSDPTRWAIVAALADGPRLLADLQTELQIEQTLLSHHLKVLRDEELVVSMREGRLLRCRLADDVTLPAGRRGIDLGCCRLELN